MKQDQFNIIIILFCVISLLFLCADVYLLPHNGRFEKIKQSTQIRTGGRKVSFTYRIESESRKMNVSEEVFAQFGDYDSLYISRSSISNVPQLLGRNKNGHFESAGINFINDGLGYVLVPIFLLFSAIVGIFYFRIRRNDLRSKLTGLAFVLSLWVLLAYFL